MHAPSLIRWDAWHKIFQARATHITRGHIQSVIWVARACQISCHTIPEYGNVFVTWFHYSSTLLHRISLGDHSAECRKRHLSECPSKKIQIWSLVQVTECHLLECLLALHWVHRQGTHPSTLPDWELWNHLLACLLALIPVILFKRIMGTCWLKLPTIFIPYDYFHEHVRTVNIGTHLHNRYSSFLF